MEAQPYSLLDDTDPFGYAKRRRMAALSPSIPPAALNPSGASRGFSPDQDESDNSEWWKPKMDPAANRISSLPGLSSSGPAGTGQSAQPQADLNTGDVSAGAGKVLNGGTKQKMPPPGMPAASDDPGAAGLPSVQAQPARQLPPGATPQVQQIEQRMADRAANPPKQIGERPQDFDPATGKEKLGAKAASWGQRLALALLSATKLAPYAQQIVRPQWSEQVAANQIGEKTDEAQLKGLESAENINSLGETRAATADWRKAQAEKAGTDAIEKQRTDQAHEQVLADAEFTKSLGKDDVITGLDANDPNIQQMQQQGYHVIDDLRDHRDGVPKMKVAIPPRFVTVSPENQQILTGRQIGSLVPWAEYKSSLQEYQKQQNALALEKAKAETAAGKPEKNKDDRYLAILQKANQGIPLTPEEAAYQKSYQTFTKETKIDPGVIRMEVLNQGRPIQTLDDQGNIRYDTSGHAMKTGALAPGNIPGSTRATQQFAKSVIDQVPTLQSEVQELKDELGPSAGRWNELWVNKAGLNDPRFAGLDQDLKMYASAIVRTHFGLGGGEDIRKGLEKNFSEAQSPEDLKSRIEHADKWVQGYAKMGNPSNGKQPPAAPGGITLEQINAEVARRKAAAGAK